jgi:HAD superfamily hydrolase (TIGR01484 family)
VSGHPDIRLLLADVDGTLVTQDKVLTEAAKEAVRELYDASIALAITSGRPPRGMSMLIKPLALRGAIAGFNGGVFVNPDLSQANAVTDCNENEGFAKAVREFVLPPAAP